MALLTLLITVLIITAVLYVVGMMLPRAYQAKRSDHIDATPSQVWSIMINHLQEKDWRNDLAEVEKLPSRQGRPVWKEIRRDRKPVVLQTVESEAAKLLVREIIENKEIGGTYRFELEPAETGCRLTVTHHALVFKPFARLKTFLFAKRTEFVDRYLNDLKQRVLHLKDEE